MDCRRRRRGHDVVADGVAFVGRLALFGLRIEDRRRSVAVNGTEAGTDTTDVGAMLLLCSRNAGSFITGAEIYVDGGFTGNRF